MQRPATGAESASIAIYPPWDASVHRAALTGKMCFDIQAMVSADVMGLAQPKANAIESLRCRVRELAFSIENYSQAMSLLEKGFTDKSRVEWSHVTDLVRFHSGQIPLQRRSVLVRTSNDLLTAFCSQDCLRLVLGDGFGKADALVLRTGNVRRCLCSHTQIGDHKVDSLEDDTSCFGLAYPPRDPGLPVGMLDMGLERLLLHFVLQGKDFGGTAFERASLTLGGNKWDVVVWWGNDHRKTAEEEAQAVFSGDRLQYLSQRSGLLDHLLAGKVPDRVVLLDVTDIAIKDDNWDAARLQYRLGSDERIVPLFVSNGVWVPSKPWAIDSYYSFGGTYQNRNFFRTREDIGLHGKQ